MRGSIKSYIIIQRLHMILPEVYTRQVKQSKDHETQSMAMLIQTHYNGTGSKNVSTFSIKSFH